MSHNATGTDGTCYPPEMATKERRQRGRLFHRLVTGMYYHRKKQFRFMTLTSAPNSPDIRRSWQVLVRNIRKTYPVNLIADGYVSGNALFSFRSVMEPLEFEYFAVFTNEGHGVIHCVYVGDYIPQAWLQEQWMAIHSAYGVNIKFVRPYTKERHKKGTYTRYRGKTGDKVYFPAGLAGYMLNQYLRGQNAIRTINHSRGWVYPGFVDDWQKVKRKLRGCPMDEIIHAWHEHLDGTRVPQMTLEGTPKAERLLEGYKTKQEGSRRQRSGQGRASTLFGGFQE